MKSAVSSTLAEAPRASAVLQEWRCLVLLPDGGRDWRRVHARDARAAASLLADEGLLALDVRTGPLTLSERLNQPVGGGRLPLADQALVLKQMAMLLGAGLTIDRALDLLREQMPRSRQRNWLAEVLVRVRSGESLSQAFACRPVFPSHVIGVIAAAEQSGHLRRALAMLAERVGELATARRELVTALTYPAAVLAATLLALAMVVLVVIPQFEPLFRGEEDKLPTLTLLVLTLTDLLRGYGWLLLLGALGLGGALAAWISSPASANIPVAARRRIPGMGLYDQYLAARFATVLGTLLDNGVHIVAALPLVREAMGSRRWKAWVRDVERLLQEGASIRRAFAQDGLLPSAAVRLAEVGEQGGRLGEALGEAGRIMQANAKERLDRIVSLANPVSIILLGGLVAMLIGGVMLGIFALGDLGQ